MKRKIFGILGMALIAGGISLVWAAKPNDHVQVSRSKVFGEILQHHWQGPSSAGATSCQINLDLMEASYSYYDRETYEGHGNKAPRSFAGKLKVDCGEIHTEFGVLGEDLHEYGGFELRDKNILKRLDTLEEASIGDLSDTYKVSVVLQQIDGPDLEVQILLAPPEGSQWAPSVLRDSRPLSVISDIQEVPQIHEAVGEMIDVSDELLDMASAFDSNSDFGFLSLSFAFKRVALNAIEAEPFSIHNFAKFFRLGDADPNLKLKLNSGNLKLQTAEDLKEVSTRSFGRALSGEEIEKEALNLFGYWDAITSGPACTLAKTRHLPFWVVDGEAETLDLRGLRRMVSAEGKTTYLPIRLSIEKFEKTLDVTPDMRWMRGWTNFRMTEN